MRLHRCRKRVGLLAAVLAVLVTACGSGGSAASSSGASAAAASKPVSGGNLTFVMDQYAFDWNPDHDWPVSLIIVADNEYDRLVSLGSDGKYHPWLATSWTVSKNGLVYTFQLRKGVKFWDGTPFNAQAVADNIAMWKNDKDSYNWEEIPLAGDKVIGPYTIQIDLSAPSAATLWFISAIDWGFQSPKAIAKGVDFTNPMNADSTGPYEPESLTPNSQLVLKRNPDYDWGPSEDSHQGPGYLSTITVDFVTDAAARLGDLTSGQAQVINNVPAVDIPTLEKSSSDQLLHKSAAGTVWELYLNTQSGPTADLRVREALRSALNIKQILDAVYFDAYPQAWTSLSPATPPNGAYDSSLADSYSYDPAEANKLLNEAGWTGRNSAGYRTKDGQQLTLTWLFNTTTLQDQRDTLAQAFQQAAKAVGIDLVIKDVTEATWTTDVDAGDYNVVDRAWEEADPNVLAHFTAADLPSNGGNNFSRVTSDASTLAALEKTIRQSTSDTARAAAAQEIQQLADQNVWTIPIYPQQSNIGAADDVKGLSFDLDGWLGSFYDTWISS